MTPTACVLLANEPRAYREAMAVALCSLRPDVQVLAVDPDGLADELVRRRPRLVVCSELTEPVRTLAGTWVLLYPDGARLVVSSRSGRQTTGGGLDLDGLVALVDGATAAPPASA